MSSILRRLLSHNINVPRKFCTAAAAAVNRELLEPPSSPWLMLPPSFLGRGHVTYNLYSPTKCKVVSFNNRGGQQETDLMRDEHTRMVGSSHGWLALYNSRTCDMFLSNPLSGRRIDLPPRPGKPFLDKEELYLKCKVIISCSPNDDDCRALMILGNQATLCRPGRSNEWAPLGRWHDNPLLTDEDFDDLKLYTDFVYSAPLKKFLGLSERGRSLRHELEGWDTADPVWPRTVRLDRFATGESCSLGTCLVSGEHPDQLFLLKRSFCDTEVKVKVYRIKVCGELELCSSLDDLVMFVGINHSFAVKASQFPQLKPNSIYFSGAGDLFGRSRYVGIFDYQNKTCSPIYYPSLDQKDSTPQPWFTPTLD